MKFLYVVCFCVVASAAWPLDREAFTITKYDLAITVDPQQQRLGARGRITARNDSPQPQKIIALQISSSLDWRSIRVEDKPVQYVTQPYQSDIDHTGALSEALVTLPAEVKPQDSVQIEIGYEGVIRLDATRLTRVGVPEAIAKHSSWDQISKSFTAVRGAGYVTWYPITTASADFSEGNSLFEVTDRWRGREAESSMKLIIVISADVEPQASHLTVLCNGTWMSMDTRGGSPHQHSATCDYERMGVITPMFAMADYNHQEGTKSPLYLFSLRGDEDGAATYSNAFEPAMKFVSGWFGPPNAPVAIADFADPNSAPFESGTLLMASMAAEDSKLAGMNVVHQLVHSALPSARPWVYEGLAHFAEALYREQQGGRQAALDYLGLHRAAFLDAEKEVPANPQPKNAAVKNAGQPLVSTFDETYYRSKAAYVWWMLRDIVGGDALKQAIAKYRAADDKDPKYVETLVEAAAKRDLGWFFDDWVYHDRGLPDLRVQAAHPWKGENDVQFLTVTLENLGNAGAEVPFTITYEGGEVTKRLEVRAKSMATTRVEVGGAPSQVVVNDGSVPESDLSNNVFKITEP